VTMSSSSRSLTERQWIGLGSEETTVGSGGDDGSRPNTNRDEDLEMPECVHRR